jgi:hypothetical protein
MGLQWAVHQLFIDCKKWDYSGQCISYRLATCFSEGRSKTAFQNLVISVQNVEGCFIKKALKKLGSL